MFLAKKPSCECVQSFYSSLGPNQGALSGIYQFTFADAGNFDYYCILHPWMLGTINVE